MEVGYQVGQVVLRGHLDLQQQWRDQLEQFREARNAGFDTYCWAHHYMIDPFQHFQPFPVLARLAAEPGNMKLATSVLLLPLLNPVEVAEQVARATSMRQPRRHAACARSVTQSGDRPAPPAPSPPPSPANGGPAQR